MFNWSEIKIILIILSLLLIPGWAFLAVTGLWRGYKDVQRWFMALIIGVAFYPILYYMARTLTPNLRIGETKLTVLLILMMGLIAWFMRTSWREQFKIGNWGWIVIGVLIATLFSRLTLAHQYPYLVNGDPLHHTLITEITSVTGQLPRTLEPYDSAILDQYHLGLYSLTATLKLLAGIPADKALLWMAQFLNGLCGVGVFLVLDRKISRFSAIIGMVTAGLLYVFPAYYINWGRFTQNSAEILILPAALVTWDVISPHMDAEKGFLWKKFFPIILAIILNAAVCFLHFRVAGYMLPLIIGVCVLGIYKSQKNRKAAKESLIKIVLIGLLTTLIILPVLIPGLRIYLDERTSNNSQTAVPPLSESPYYAPDKNHIAISSILDSKYIFVLISLGLIGGIYSKKTRALSILTIFWVISLLAEGFLYLLNVRVITFTNITAVLITIYLPLGLAAGIIGHNIQEWLNKYNQNSLRSFILFLIIMAGFFGSFARVDQIEVSRIKMTSEDEKAMRWIKQNTPKDAVFVVNTVTSGTSLLAGTDAGYWITYYADRETTALTFLSSFGNNFDFYKERAEAVQTLYGSDPSTKQICEMGVDYLYSGVITPSYSHDFNITEIAKLPDVQLVYDQDGVQILKICE